LMMVPALIGSVMEDIDLNVEPNTAVAALIIEIHKRILPGVP
jgi:hypothetical protein